MPETEVDTVTQQWLQSELRSATDNIMILDCRSTNEFQEGHIRSAVNFSIPSIMLRRLAAGKIDLTSTIKCRDLKERIQNAYSDSVFILYNDHTAELNSACNTNTSSNTHNNCSTTAITTANNTIMGNGSNDAATINVLHRRLKQDGCRVFCLEDGFTSFRDAFPEWCEDDSTNVDAHSHRGTGGPTEQLMGLRSLRISTPHSDSACSSSADSSDCEGGGGGGGGGLGGGGGCGGGGGGNLHPQMTEQPVEIVPLLFLGNALHSGDARALQRYNIKYVLNVTPDLPNVFEADGGINYLQIPITDHWSQDLAVHFPAAINFIDEARSKRCAVLVHCLAGVSRSVTVTLAYLMHERSLCLNDAFSLVRQRKPDVSPNFHFMEQLHSFELQLKSNPNRTPLSAVSTDSCYLTPDCDSFPLSGGGSGGGIGSTNMYGAGGSHPSAGPASTGRSSKYSCACLEVECKCMLMQTQQYQHLMHTTTSDYLGTGIGVSPDSGIEFDRWTPATDGTPK